MLKLFFILFMVFNSQMAFAQQDKVEEHDGVKTFTTYFKNGKIKSIEKMGNVFGCYMYIDTAFYFDNSGNVFKENVFESYMPKNATGCHESIQIITSVGYDKNQISYVKRYFMGYESSEKTPCGIQLTYDKFHKKKQVVYKDCKLLTDK